MLQASGFKILLVGDLVLTTDRLESNGSCFRANKGEFFGGLLWDPNWASGGFVYFRFLRQLGSTPAESSRTLAPSQTGATAVGLQYDVAAAKMSTAGNCALNYRCPRGGDGTVPSCHWTTDRLYRQVSRVVV